MNNENQILILRDNAKNDLEQIKTVESGIEYKSKLDAIEAWGKAKKLDAELMTIIHEQTLRCERALGKLIKEGQEKGEIASQSDHGKGIQTSVPNENTRPKTLEEIGLTRKESSKFQKLDDIPEEQFEAILADKKNDVEKSVRGLTASGIIKSANDIEDKAELKELTKNQLEQNTIDLIVKINAMPVLYRMKIKQAIK